MKFDHEKNLIPNGLEHFADKPASCDILINIHNLLLISVTFSRKGYDKYAMYKSFRF